MKIIINKKDLNKIAKGETEHKILISDYPLYASVNNLTKKEIAVIGELIKLDLEAYNKIEIEFI